MRREKVKGRRKRETVIARHPQISHRWRQLVLKQWTRGRGWTHWSPVMVDRGRWSVVEEVEPCILGTLAYFSPHRLESCVRGVRALVFSFHSGSVVFFFPVGGHAVKLPV